MGTRITVLIRDGETSREVTFTAARWEQHAAGPTTRTMPDPEAGRLDLYAGTKVVASFMVGTWMGVWYTTRKVTDDRRF